MVSRDDRTGFASNRPRSNSSAEPSSDGAKESWSAAHHDAIVVTGIVALSIAIALAVTLPFFPASTSGPEILRSAPDFTLGTDRGSNVTLSQLKGQVVVIDFVVLVCCTQSALEVGYVMEVEPQVRDQGVVFVSIAMDSDSNYYSPQEYRQIMGFNWTLALDLDGGVQRSYDATETSTFVIDRLGMIRYHDDQTTPSATLSAWIQQVV